MKCPKCQFDNPSNSKFCKKCGTQLLAVEEVSVTKALKLIKPEIASDKKRIERFSNELKMARS